MDVVRYAELWRHDTAGAAPASAHRWRIDQAADRVSEQPLRLRRLHRAGRRSRDGHRGDQVGPALRRLRDPRLRRRPPPGRDASRSDSTGAGSPIPRATRREPAGART
jgi:hypothetical protein